MQSVPVSMIAAASTGGAFGGGAGMQATSDFVRIGMALEALLWAYLGGWVACYFASGRELRTTSHDVAAAGSSEAPGT
jgi:hypothetical protein